MTAARGETKNPGMFADLTTEELRTLGGMLSSGGMAAGEGLSRDPGRTYDMAIEILDISTDLHHMARHREEAEAGEPEPQAEAEPW